MATQARSKHLVWRAICSGIIVMLCGVVVQSHATTTSAQVTQTTPLKQQPMMQADNITSLQAQQSITINARQGGWYQVQTSDETKLQGWLPLFFVRFTQPTKTAVTPLNLPRSNSVFKSSQQVTSTTGVRGLNRGDIESSTGDFAALVTMQKFELSASDLGNFGQSVALQANPDIKLEHKP